MNFIKKNWSKFVLISYAFFIPLISWADEHAVTCNPAGGTICNPLQNTTSISELIHNVLVGMLTLGIPIVALAIVYSGFLFVFARGNTEKLTSAKKTLMYTLIGAAILLGSWAIAKLISTTVNAL
ncbi:MAG TPA: pilin [Candidatus Paceibacterota bacterium]